MLITDRRLADDLTDVVRRAIAGGVDAVMLREKDLSTDALVRFGQPLRRLCASSGVTFVVNHDLEAALRLVADGVHLGHLSPPVGAARSVLGSHAIVGVSVHDDVELAAAIAAGADYVTFGPVFETPSKQGVLAPRGRAGLERAISLARDLPVLALGGLDSASAAGLSRTGAAGLAVIRAVVTSPDPEAAAAGLLAAWRSA